jgi:hypothetical protein
MTNAVLQNVTLSVPLQHLLFNIAWLVEVLVMTAERLDTGGRKSIRMGDSLFNDAVSKSDDSVNGCKIMNKLQVGGTWK